MRPPDGFILCNPLGFTQLWCASRIPWWEVSVTLWTVLCISAPQSPLLGAVAERETILQTNKRNPCLYPACDCCDFHFSLCAFWLFILLCSETGSPGQPWPHYVDQACLKFKRSAYLRSFLPSAEITHVPPCLAPFSPSDTDQLTTSHV